MPTFFRPTPPPSTAGVQTCPLRGGGKNASIFLPPHPAPSSVGCLTRWLEPRPGGNREEGITGPGMRLSQFVFGLPRRARANSWGSWFQKFPRELRAGANGAQGGVRTQGGEDVCAPRGVFVLLRGDLARNCLPGAWTCSRDIPDPAGDLLLTNPYLASSSLSQALAWLPSPQASTQSLSPKLASTPSPE